MNNTSRSMAQPKRGSPARSRAVRPAGRVPRLLPLDEPGEAEAATTAEVRMFRVYAGEDEASFPGAAATGRTGLAACVAALRPHHWAKNTLLFLPLVLAHDFSPAGIFRAGIAFLAFCCCASAIYLVNDLRDIDADRRHPQKRLRPIAAGELSAPRASSWRQGCWPAA